MKNIRWQLIIILVTGLVIGILLLSEQTGFNIARPTQTRGGTYTEALFGKLQRLNPILDYYNQADRDVDSLIFSSLIRFDENGLPQSDLAITWGISFVSRGCMGRRSRCIPRAWRCKGIWGIDLAWVSP